MKHCNNTSWQMKDWTKSGGGMSWEKERDLGGGKKLARLSPPYISLGGEEWGAVT